MKNTRKKMLLSSIAMLLVALVALGSATYAWFNESPEANARGLTMKTTAGTGLLALSETHNTAKANDWSHNTVLNASTTLDNGNVVPSTTAINLDPASLSNSDKSAASTRETIGTFYKANAATGDNYALPTSFTASSITPALSGASVYKEQVKLKLTGGATSATAYLKGITWTVPDSSYDMCDTVRVAITDTDGKLIAIFANSAAQNKYLTDDHTISSSNFTATAKNDALGTRPSIGSVTADASKYINVYVYIDGEDHKCVAESCTGANVISDLSIDLTLKQTG